MKKIVCRRDYHKYSTTDLDTFANEVRNGIYTNSGMFNSPPISQEEYTSRKESFETAAAEYVQYGITKKQAFLVAKDMLIEVLDKLATYVDMIADGNVSTIALSGFVPTSETARPAAPLAIIVSFEVSLTKTSGQVSIVMPAYPNQTNVDYTCVCVEGNPLTSPFITNGQLRITADDKNVVIDCNRARNKTISGLTPGVKYFFYVFASNSAGVSPLSNPQSIYAS